MVFYPNKLSINTGLNTYFYTLVFFFSNFTSFAKMTVMRIMDDVHLRHGGTRVALYRGVLFYCNCVFVIEVYCSVCCEEETKK